MDWTDGSLGTPGRLDDDVAFILAKAAELNLPPLWTMTPAEARAEFARRVLRTNPVPPAGIAAHDHAIPGPGGAIPMRSYSPDGVSARGDMLYFHGGGFVVGDLETHDPICRVIAARTSCTVHAVHYRLAPEHPFPAAAEDAKAALDWLAAGPGHGRPMAVAGDSAGGTLAAVTARYARTRSIPLALQALIYPAVDQTGQHPSRLRLAEGYILTGRDIQWFNAQYFGPRPQPVPDADASPLRAGPCDGQAPALVVTCGFDPLVDEGKAYVAALRRDGVAVRSVCIEGGVHGCLGLAAYLGCGRAVLDEVCTVWDAVLS